MVKKKGKRVLAFLCAATLLIANSVWGLPGKQAEAGAAVNQTLPTDFTEVTPFGFGIPDFTNNSGENFVGTGSPVASANKVVLKANVVFGRSTLINYLYNPATTGGLQFLANQNMYLYNWLSPSGSSGIYVGGQFANGEYTEGELVEGRNYYLIRASKVSSTENFDTMQVAFALTTEFVDFDGGGNADDLKLGVWFNEKLYNDTYFYIRNCQSVHQPYLSMGVKSVSSPEITPKPTPTLPTDFTEIEPVDFGIYNGSYTGKTTGIYTPVDTMNQVLLETDITYPARGGISYMKDVTNADKTIAVNYSGGALRVWNSLSADTKFYVDGVTQDYLHIRPSVALDGAGTFDNVKFHLSMTTEYVDCDGDNKVNDIKLGLWFNGKLYDDRYVYIKDCAETCVAYLSLSGVAVETLDGEAPVIPEPTLPEITFIDFDVNDGTYGYNKNELAISGTYNDGVANKSFVGTMNFSNKKSTSINIGGKSSAWEGVKLVTMGDDKLYFSEAYDRFPAIEINEADVPVALKENDVRVRLSIEVADVDDDGAEDDVRFWLYFENELYQGRPIKQMIDYAQYLGAYLGIYSTNEQSSVTIGSVEIERPILTPPTLPEITFSDFRVEDGTYSYKDKSLAAIGKRKEGIADSTFVGIVNFTSEKSTSINFGGIESAWEGVKLVTLGDNELYFSEAYDRFPAIFINQGAIDVPIKDADVEIRLTFEVTDLDEDGAEDDVRFWLCFGGVLYKGQPIVEAVDYAQYLGTFLGIYSNSEKSSVIVKSKDLNRPLVEVDFSVMGFSEDWAKTLAYRDETESIVVHTGNKAPYTGDYASIQMYVILSVLSCGVLGVLYERKKSR